jgi:hypothetical protein
MGRDGVDWIYLARDRGIWWAVVNTVMNLGFGKTRQTFLTEELSAYEGQRFMELESI